MYSDVAQSRAEIKVVAWPSPQDFNEAVQNPQHCFADAELRSGQPQLNPLGLPKPATGNFASVYRLQCADVDYAVRCFLNPLVDQQHRYSKLEETLCEIHAPYTLGFDFIEQGINVKGTWFPIVKMEWAQGLPLIDYIKGCAGNAQLLYALAAEFKRVTLDMRSHGIAHGDLQHGNVFVADGEIILVDYDNFYVPAIGNMPSNELGHRNYQHPRRAADFFSDRLDNFSAWVIYVSLRALAVDPTLWDTLNGGDECILFRQKDFLTPVTSKVFRTLEAHPSQQIREETRFLRWLLQKDPALVPDLSIEPLDPVDLPELADIEDLVSSFDFKQEPLPDWVNSFGAAEPAAPEPQQQAVSKRSAQMISASSNSGAALFYCFLIFVWLSVVPLTSSKHVPASRSTAANYGGEQPLVMPKEMSDQIENPTTASQALFNKALNAQSAGTWMLAADYYQQALKANESDHGLSDTQVAKGWERLGFCQQKYPSDDNGQAASQTAYKMYQSIGDTSDAISALKAYTRALLGDGKNEEACKALVELMKLDPEKSHDNAGTYAVQAAAKIFAQDPSKSCALLEEIAKAGYAIGDLSTVDDVLSYADQMQYEQSKKGNREQVEQLVQLIDDVASRDPKKYADFLARNAKMKASFAGQANAFH